MIALSAVQSSARTFFYNGILFIDTSNTPRTQKQTPSPWTKRQTPHMPPVDRILDTCLWNHYLSATVVADGKNYKDYEAQQPPFSEDHHCKSIAMASHERNGVAGWKQPSTHLAPHMEAAKGARILLPVRIVNSFILQTNSVRLPE